VRAVLDTSVLITALRSSSGAAAENIRLALIQQITVLMDYKLACEYRDVALRVEHLNASGKTEGEVSQLLDALEAVAGPVAIFERHAPLSQDANDDMVLEVAINGGADAIVTNNVKHFRDPARLFGLQVMTPADLLNKLRLRS
jgi:putative PIN family toxin of toxin-antitoxin system